MCHISKDKGWEWKKEADTLMKIQIENSLSLGWDKKDILLVTNIPFKHEGVEALVLGDDLFCDYKPTVTKIKVILKLFELKLINDLMWFHDLDAFQLKWFTEDEVLKDMGGADFALTDYGITTIKPGYNHRPSTGSVFFNSKSKDIFEWTKAKCDHYHCNEEAAYLELTKIPKYKLKGRTKVLNITYNIATRRRNIKETYKIADKPVKVLHFHPYDDRETSEGADNMKVVMGHNWTGKPLLPPGLVKLFKKYI